jgi:hypothetical protein
MPVKITPPGGYACRVDISAQIQDEFPHTLWAYQGNSAANGRRKCVDDFDSGIQPPCQSIIATPSVRLVELRDLLSLYCDNIIRRITGL